jgi:hypothetical protein
MSLIRDIFIFVVLQWNRVQYYCGHVLAYLTALDDR